MRGIGNVKREALKEFGNGNGNCTIFEWEKMGFEVNCN